MVIIAVVIIPVVIVSMFEPAVMIATPAVVHQASGCCHTHCRKQQSKHPPSNTFIFIEHVRLQV